MMRHRGFLPGALVIGLSLTLFATFAAASAQFDELERRGVTYGVDAFMLAAGTGDMETIRLFLDAGMDVNARNELGRTALYMAALGGHEAAVRLLAASGADVNAEERNGHNALDAAKAHGFPALAELLRDLGARPSSYAERTEPTALWYYDVTL